MKKKVQAKHRQKQHWIHTWLTIVKGFTWQWRRNFTSIWILYRERRIKESFLVKTNPDKIKLLFSTQTITTKKNTLKREEEHYTKTKQTYNSNKESLECIEKHSRLTSKFLHESKPGLYISNKKIKEPTKGNLITKHNALPK